MSFEEVVNKSKFNEGFTITELLVATAVFAVAVTVVSAVFVSSVDSQRRNVNNQEVLDNARFVLEAVGRSVRQSDITTADGTGTTLAVSHPVKGAITYSLDAAAGRVLENGVALSASSVFVERLSFVVSGNAVTDQRQPKVTISLGIRNKNQKPGSDTTVNLQTTVTPRNLQIQE
ncbi:MAG: prepilin-type N-terminal cleavage/methylation domain-containing protein [Patescibacteria group bacterium]|mgnify:CR=1 FL=1